MTIDSRALRFASVRMCAYRESIRRDTWPANCHDCFIAGTGLAIRSVGKGGSRGQSQKVPFVRIRPRRVALSKSTGHNLITV
jgi:hypothetical protein